MYKNNKPSVPYVTSWYFAEAEEHRIEKCQPNHTKNAADVGGSLFSRGLAFLIIVHGKTAISLKSCAGSFLKGMKR